ncbi:MAG TPA: glycoside hydrolase family 5 protein [Gemmataceae bacterium]
MRNLPTLACALFLTAAAGAQPKGDAFETARLLGRGVNLGNALEAPREGAWGFTLREEYFPLIKEAGFDSVRIPIRWSAHAATEPPYRIDPEFFRRVDWAVDQALENDLAAVVNIHHYEELYADPPGQKERFLALWKQIAGRYKDRPKRLVFEILNEPHGKLTDALWNAYLLEALKVIRASNPDRGVIVGPGTWNNFGHLKNLKLPADDRNLIATFHYYNPFPFTHQGASWVENSDRWLGTKWTGTPQEKEAVTRDLDVAARWAEKEKRPIYLGEFGAYSRADMESRARWTRFIREQAEERNMPWAYWEFGSGFGVYDPRAKQWRQPLLEALTGK